METTLLWAQTRRCSHDTLAYERLYLRKIPRMTHWLRWVLFGWGAIRRRDVALVSTLASIAFGAASLKSNRSITPKTASPKAALNLICS